MDSVCVVCVCATILYIPAIAPPLRSFSFSFSSFVLVFLLSFLGPGNYLCVSYSSVLGAPHILFIHVYSFVPFFFCSVRVSYLPHDTAHTNYPSDY
ncbi:hypothetical protein BJ912DRAFT_982238 [Pholiota molesta]|nr:hypothetical protein BJ912DRAFT_982238 [Pholiota molesta]